MRDQDNLVNALAENGSFDPERAEAVRATALGFFDARLRKVDRWLMGYLCVATWLMVLALFQFLHATATKPLLFYGLLMLIFFEITVLMKLWYWMMNTKIGILKTLKEMQLSPSGTGTATSADESDSPISPLKGISRFERRIWWIALVAGTAAIGAVHGAAPQKTTGGSLVHDGVVTLAADGSGSAETGLSFTNDGIDTVKHFNFYALEGYEVKFLDGEGKELPFTISQPAKSDHVRYDVDLRRWAWPGMRLNYTRLEQGQQWATEDQGVWTYTNDYSYGYDTTDFVQTVVLPPGAEVVAATPWPATVYTLGDRTALRFEGVRGRNERFKFSVRFRLPTGG